jgi:hypothetical protein
MKIKIKKESNEVFKSVLIPRPSSSKKKLDNCLTSTTTMLAMAPTI